MTIRSSFPVVGACLVLACATLWVAGCDDQNAPRSRVVITQLIPPGSDEDILSSGFQSDVLDAGDDGIPLTADDVITEDALLVTVENQPASPLLTVSAGGPFSSVVLTNYRITYDIPGEELEPIAGAMHLVVESGSSATASVVVVTALAKSVPPLSSLAAGGDELMGSATLTLRGYEQTSEDEIVSEATLAVHFANWQD